MFISRSPTWQCGNAQLSSGVKILSSTKVTSFGIGTLLLFDSFYFYFTTFLQKILHFLLHTFFLTPKSTHYILNASDRKTVQLTHLSREHPWSTTASDMEDALKHKCFCTLGLSVGVCPWLAVHFLKTRKLCLLVCLI